MLRHHVFMLLQVRANSRYAVVVAERLRYALSYRHRWRCHRSRSDLRPCLAACSLTRACTVVQRVGGAPGTLYRDKGDEDLPAMPAGLRPRQAPVFLASMNLDTR